MLSWTPLESLSENGGGGGSGGVPSLAPARSTPASSSPENAARQVPICPPPRPPARLTAEINDLRRHEAASPPSMTYSASCPSFSGVYELSAGSDELLRALTASGDAMHDSERAVHGASSAGSLLAAMQDPVSAVSLPFAHEELGLQPAGMHLSGAEEPLELSGGGGGSGGGSGSGDFLPDKSYDLLMQFQQEQLNSTQRMFPHQQLIHDDVDGALMPPHAGAGPQKRVFHGSASFTNLSSMETELQRRQNAASKRKKGGNERWQKLQRHKSFDSTMMPNLDFGQPSFSAPPGSNYFGPSAPPIAPPPSMPNVVPLMHSLNSADNDILSMEDFPPNFAAEPAWPATSMPLNEGMLVDSFGGGDAGVMHGISPLHGVPTASSPQQQSPQGVAGPFMRRSSDPPEAMTIPEDKQLPDDVQTSAELDMLLSEKERENMSSLFDAIRDFSAPTSSTMRAAPTPQLSSSAPTPSFMESAMRQRRGTPVMRRKDSRGGVVSKRKTTHSPPLHPNSRGRDDSTHGKAAFSLDSGSPPSGLPPQRPQDPPTVPMRKRLEQILVHSVQNSDAGAMLSVSELEFLKQSPLFSTGKASETAGSLWLLLHAAQCDNACEISGCDVMRRVLNHCMSCDLPVGKCKQPCNDAKAMLLHYGSCNSKGSMHGKSCSVCWNLLEIDHAHQAVLDSGGNASTPSSATATPPTPPIAAQNLLPMPMNPLGASSFVSMRPSPSAPSSSSGSASKHVLIQPNPMPTASNPMGLIGSFPHFGYSLSLYLEQTSAPFRAEVKARVEKRVTAAASQDLVQHMQKKTRLRSLDDLRSEARTVVLGEMERELHFHMQAYSWATSNGKSVGGDSGATYPGGMPGDSAALPPYLLSVAAAGFAALYAQQATLQAAMSTPGQSAPNTGRASASSSQAAGTSSSSAPSTSRRKNSISSDSKKKKKRAESESESVACAAAASATTTVEATTEAAPSASS